MAYQRVVISSGHGKYVRGASSDMLDEVDEARLVVAKVAGYLTERGIDVNTFHDNTSHTQNDNLNTIVNFHNAQADHDLDISVHFNAYEQVDQPMGCEVLYLTQGALAEEMSSAIARAGGLIDRGPKKRTDLFFLNSTDQPSILIETCFVDSVADVELYEKNLDEICEAIADVIKGDDDDDSEAVLPSDEILFRAAGSCSYFGGPDDEGVSADEGLAFIDDIMDQPCLFLPYQPDDATGLARRLNPFIHYIACRWDYDVTSKSDLLKDVALVRALKTGIALMAFPADWGPHENTGRIADLSPGLMKDLGIETDDEVEVIFPWIEPE